MSKKINIKEMKGYINIKVLETTRAKASIKAKFLNMSMPNYIEYLILKNTKDVIL